MGGRLRRLLRAERLAALLAADRIESLTDRLKQRERELQAKTSKDKAD